MRVLEIGDRAGRQVAAAVCGKHLARWGAEVIRVDPTAPDEPEPEVDRHFLHGGKRRLALDLATAEGRDLLERLAARCDAVVSDLAPPDIDAVDLFALGGEGPRVRASLTPFGLSGPCRDWRATPSTLLAGSGHTFLVGDPGRAPLTLPGRYPDHQAGLLAYSAVLASWLERQRRPELAAAALELSLHECLASLHQFTVVRWMYQGAARQRVGNRFEGLAPIGLLRCADGWWGLNVLPAFWRAFAAMIERPALLEDPRFKTLAGRWEHIDALEALIEEATRDWTFDDVMERGAQFRVPVGVALSLEALLGDPHLEARGFWREVGGLRVPGSPFRAVGEPPLVERPGTPPGDPGGALEAAS